MLRDRMKHLSKSERQILREEIFVKLATQTKNQIMQELTTRSGITIHIAEILVNAVSKERDKLF